MIEAFTHDIQRIIQVTPVQDVTDQVILAKVYLDGCYKGIANTVRPDEDAAQVLLELVNGQATSQDNTVTIYGKNRFEDIYTQLSQQVVSVAHNATASETLGFDPQDYDEFRVGFANNLINVHSVTVLKRQYQTVQGLVVGGASGEKIAVPCDFRRFPPAEEYHMVFVAEDTGVIGREILNLFGKDGYGFEGCEHS